MRRVYLLSILAIFVVFSFAVTGAAQTPTSTPTATPTSTATPTPTATGINPDVRAYSKFGTASATPAKVNVGFRPAFIRLCNDDATDTIFFNFVTGIGATTDALQNFKIIKGDNCPVMPIPGGNPNNQFIIGIVASANTPAYRIMAWRGKE
jgi:hypothetical protein